MGTANSVVFSYDILVLHISVLHIQDRKTREISVGASIQFDNSHLRSVNLNKYTRST